MPYVLRKITCGDVVEIEKVYSSNYKRNIQRGEKTEPTSEEMLKINERNSIKKLRRLLNTNFTYQDLHVVLSYKKSARPTPQEAKRDLDNFLKRTRRYFKKHDGELKYITVTEYKNTAIHHHVVMNYMDIRDLDKLWSHGRVRVTPMDKSGQYGALAEYLVKETKKTFRDLDGVSKKRWNPSKSLEKPKVEEKIVNRNRWSKHPRPLKGYKIEEDTVRNGISEFNGREYQFYSMVRIPSLDEVREQRKLRKVSGED